MRQCRREWVMLNRVLGLTLWLAVATLAPVHAAIATTAFQGTLTIDILDDLFQIPAAAAGQAPVDPITGSFALEAGVFGVTDFGGDFPPNRPPDIIPPVVEGARTTYVTDAGVFAPRADGTVGGPMALLGSFDFLGSGDALLLSIPLDPIGEGGTAAGFAPPPLDTVLSALTIGMLWTTGTATANDVIVDGVPGQSLSRSGFDQRDANGLGPIRLVTASEMEICQIPPDPLQCGDPQQTGFFVRVPTFATLDLVFLPEPCTGALLALGLTALVRKSRPRG